MKILLYYIKGIFTSLNFLIFLLLLAWLASRLQKKKLSHYLVVTASVLFLLCSTAYLPQFLAKKLENQYSTIDLSPLKQHKGKVYIHLLGSGYGADKRLPPTAQLARTAQGRLIEAIRIYRQLDSSVLICSGSSISDVVSQAQVARNAAIMLGVDSTRIITLDTPSTTREEAVTLKERVGINSLVIIVTDAIHMPRAVKLFSQKGLRYVAAPTNFKVLQTVHDLSVKWWPSGENIYLMDLLLHEYLGNLKNVFSSL